MTIHHEVFEEWLLENCGGDVEILMDAVSEQARECNDLRARLDSARAILEKAQKALGLSGKRCEHVHHPHALRHAAGESCPVERRIETASQEIDSWLAGGGTKKQ